MNITLEHNGKTYLGEIGTVERTMLGYEDHGIFTGALYFDFGGSGQGYGFRALSTKYTYPWIAAILEVAGVREWERVKESKLVALRSESYGTIEGIADLSGSQVMIADEHAKSYGTIVEEEGGN